MQMHAHNAYAIATNLQMKHLTYLEP